MKKCSSYPGYSATADGRIFSHRKRGNLSVTESRVKETPVIELSQNKSPKGYMRVSVRKAFGTFSSAYVHVLVADAYHGPRPIGMCVRHLDGNSLNNHSSNLKYGTLQDNADDRREHGRYHTGPKHPNAKLSKRECVEIWSKRKKGIKVKDLASMFSVSTSTIESIIYRRTYRCCEFERVER